MSNYIGEEICLNMKYVLIIVLCVVQVMYSNDFDMKIMQERIYQKLITQRSKDKIKYFKFKLKVIDKVQSRKRLDVIN